MSKDEQQQLKDRVEIAIAFLKHKYPRNAKNVFFDECYGAMFKSETTRLDNLWACNTCDRDFTNTIERFAENPTQFDAKRATFNRFMKFVDWYMRLGGEPLSAKEIEKVFPKF